jgi:predicted Zn-dependent peptidase
MNRIGRSELDHGRQRTMQESLEKIAAVTPAEVAALAADLLSQDLTAAVVGPYGSSEDLPAALHDLA